MNERLDPEEVEGIMNRIKNEAVRIVERHGGIVNQFVGDEVVALFGIPRAHADDPPRAVRAALELHQVVQGIGDEVEGKIGQPLRMHTGIHSGLIVSSRRDDRDGRFGVTGDTVNLGARLASAAATDEILVSPETRRLITPAFETKALAAVAMKGKTHPVVPHRVIREAETTEEARTLFVGRKAEVLQFSGALEACLQAENGQTIYVRGDAGIGKTRLVRELQRIAGSKGFICHSGLVLDFGMGTERGAIRDLVRSFLALAPGSGEDIRQRALGEALAKGHFEPNQEIFLNDILDLPQPLSLRGLYDAMEDETRNEGKREVVAGLLGALSANRPRLVFVEDIHWADEETLAHLPLLAATVAGAPALLVVTSRVAGDPLSHNPSNRNLRSAMAAHPMMTIDLAPLRANEAIEFAGEFLDLTQSFAMNCVERAAGNPLFLEQLLRNAEETSDQALPGSVQSIILARVDSLEPLDKQAIQAASILGQRFHPDVLRHLLDHEAYNLQTLLEHNLVRPEGAEFLFSHALVQEGVYHSLLKSRAKSLHRRAADWYAKTDKGLRAEHLERAEDPAAPHAYLEAALEQKRAYRYPKAQSHLDRGVKLATTEEDRFNLQIARGDLLHDLGAITESFEAYNTSLDLAEDDPQRCRVLIGLAACMRMKDRYEEALKALDEAERLGSRHGLTKELSRLHHLRGNIYFPLANTEGCLEQHTLALGYAREIGSVENEARALGGLGDGYFIQGKMRTAADLFRRCVELSREEGLGRVEVAYQYMIANSVIYLVNAREAMTDCLEALDTATKINDRRAEMLARVIIGLFRQVTGEWEEVRDQSERVLQLAGGLEAVRFEGLACLFQGLYALSQGNRAEALRHGEASLEICRNSGMGFIGPWVLAAVASATDDPIQRRESLEEGRCLLKEGSISHNHLWFHRLGIERFLTLGDWDEVDRFAMALEDYTRSEPLPWCDFVIAWGRTLAAHGRDQGQDQDQDQETLARELMTLRETAVRMDWNFALPALETALAFHGEAPSTGSAER